jgi:DNA-binding winged helix-turn-helix (wHTH) protein/tetratricopeptide (TPR) repeat protein
MIHRMEAKIYKFGDFCLNPVARELSRDGEPLSVSASAFDCLVYLIEHRERPIGKDELISAVWGRTDVSENLLAQTIVRLRRVLGNAGNEQGCIKTVPRVGYRWMVDTAETVNTVASVVKCEQVDVTTEAIGGPTAALPEARPIRRFLLLVLGLFLTLAVAGYYGWQAYRPKPFQGATRFDKGTTVVLPVLVDAPEDWKWLQLGLMDMISNRMREARVPTENSQDVLNLLNQGGQTANAGLSSFAFVVSPHVALEGNRWRVHLDAKSKDGHAWEAEESSDDVFAATRAASDLLLVQLGAEPDTHAPGGSQSEYLLRIEAAELAGQPQLAHKLIDDAPPYLRDKPELAFAQATLDCAEGKQDSCEQRLTDLLKQLSAKEQPVLRGKALSGLWFVYKKKHQFAEGEAALSEAVRLLQGQKDVDALATAYLDRSHLKFFRGNLEEASVDLGQARVNYALAGDTTGQAKVDFAMGMIAERRGQFQAALPLLQRADNEYQRMGIWQLFSATLDSLASTHEMLLQFPDELATTDRFWPFDQRHMNFVDDYVRHELTLTRAIALADNGRTSEASTLLEHVFAEASSENEADFRAEVSASMAKLALERGENDKALSWITKAMAGSALNEEGNERDYGDAWLIYVTILQRTGKIEELKRGVSAMQAWTARLPRQDDWIAISVMQANAIQAWGEGNRDVALDKLKLAMSAADKLGVPEVIVSVGQSYAQALLNAGHVDEAAAVSGRLSEWSAVDWRAAWVEARVYEALGRTASWQQAYSRAKQLAGDRSLPVSSTVAF